MMSKSIRVSATCIADIANASPATRLRKLQPFKFKDRGEGAGRSAYYKRTIDTVREYHRNGNDPKLIQRTIEKLTKIESDDTAPKRDKTKARRNIDALLAYEDIYGNRKFRVSANHRLAFTVGDVTVTAQPDLWVEENGTAVLLKIGAAINKSADYVDLMLHLIRKAAIACKYRVRARNVVYLDVNTGEEIISHLPLKHFNRRIRSTCNTIVELWPEVKERVSAASA